MTVTIRDSYLLLTSSLQKLGKTFGIEEKGLEAVLIMNDRWWKILCSYKCIPL